MNVPVFRFAPSPNGHLHLGHALSALLNVEAVRVLNGRLLVRIEDIDRARCTEDLERDLLDDLSWIGVCLDGGPIMRQSERFAVYQAALKRLDEMGFLYRSYATRGEVKRFVAEYESQGQQWMSDPDGAPLYPGDDKVLTGEERDSRAEMSAPYAIRLNMAKALEHLDSPLSWSEGGAEGADLATEFRRIDADPAVWGDVVLARKDTPTSYHLSVVVDDAAQGITDVLRGLDLYHATAVHRLLQVLLGLPEPRYRHHRLILGEDGRKLSKSSRDTSLRDLRLSGTTMETIRKRIGL